MSTRRPAMTRALPILTALLVGSVAACDRRTPPEVHAPGLTSRTQVAPVEPIAHDRIVAGQTIYVPAYSSIYIADQAHPFNLAVTLSIRNTDRAQPIVVTSVNYHDREGKLVRGYIDKPLRIGSLASADFFVTESDTSGGGSASFLVEWVAESEVTAPVVEAVMVGTASTQGVSFTCPGRVLHDRGAVPVAPASEKRGPG